MTFRGPTVLALAAALYAAGGVFNIQPDETGVAFVFGRAGSALLDPGIHWNPPWPFGRVVVQKTATSQTLSVGYGSEAVTSGQASARAADLWLTGGSSMVRVRFDIQYTVSDLYAFLVQGETPTEILRAVAERNATRFLVQNSVDNILTSRRQVLRQDIQGGMQEVLDRHNLGIQIRSVDIAELSPPQDGEVDIAFQQVQSARSDRERAIQDALSQQAQITSGAAAKARELEERARAERFARVELAKGDADRFLALAREHAAAPAMTEQRLYLERREKLLPRTKLFIVEPSGDGRFYHRPASPG